MGKAQYEAAALAWFALQSSLAYLLALTPDRYGGQRLPCSGSCNAQGYAGFALNRKAIHDANTRSKCSQMRFGPLATKQSYQ